MKNKKNVLNVKTFGAVSRNKIDFPYTKLFIFTVTRVSISMWSSSERMKKRFIEKNVVVSQFCTFCCSISGSDISTRSSNSEDFSEDNDTKLRKLRNNENCPQNYTNE